MCLPWACPVEGLQAHRPSHLAGPFLDDHHLVQERDDWGVWWQLPDGAYLNLYMQVQRVGLLYTTGRTFGSIYSLRGGELLTRGNFWCVHTLKADGRLVTVNDSLLELAQVLLGPIVWHLLWWIRSRARVGQSQGLSSSTLATCPRLPFTLVTSTSG